MGWFNWGAECMCARFGWFLLLSSPFAEIPLENILIVENETDVFLHKAGDGRLTALNTDSFKSLSSTEVNL